MDKVDVTVADEVDAMMINKVDITVAGEIDVTEEGKWALIVMNEIILKTVRSLIAISMDGLDVSYDCRVG